MRIRGIFLLLLLLSGNIKAANDSTSSFLPMFRINVGAHLPGGDMKKRFGMNGLAGGDFAVLTKYNILLGAEFQFLFGNNVKEDSILKNLRTSNGNIIGQDGMYSSINIFERGFTTFLTAAKLIPIPGTNNRSAIIIGAGGGFLQHKIRIEVRDNTVPQLSKEYKKGYDRLSNGAGLKEFIGYTYSGKRRGMNFYALLEFHQFTSQSRRSFNFDTRQADTNDRLDMLSGIRFGWIVPLRKRDAEAYYYR